MSNLIEIVDDGVLTVELTESIVATSGATTFLGLTDSPNSYTGEALKVVRVNAGETALEFGTAGAGTGIDNVVEDTSPQLGGDLDANGFDVLFDDNNGILDSDGNELLLFQGVSGATDYLVLQNGDDISPGPATYQDYATLICTGDEDEVGLNIFCKGEVNNNSGNHRIVARFQQTTVVDPQDGPPSTSTYLNFKSGSNHGETTIASRSDTGTHTPLCLACQRFDSLRMRWVDSPGATALQLINLSGATTVEDAVPYITLGGFWDQSISPGQGLTPGVPTGGIFPQATYAGGATGGYLGNGIYFFAGPDTSLSNRSAGVQLQGCLAADGFNGDLTVMDGVLLGTAAVDDGPAAMNALVYPGFGNLGFADNKGIYDHAAKKQLIFQTVSSAVNYVEMTNGATGTGPTIAAKGTDSNVKLHLTGQGTGGIRLTPSDSAGVAQVELYNASTGAFATGLYFNKDTSSPAANDEVAVIEMIGRDSGNAAQGYASIYAYSDVVTAGSEDGRVEFYTCRNGTTYTQQMVMGKTGGVAFGSTPSTMPGTGSIRVTGIELGADTDTTLTRAAGGALAIEGVRVAMCGKQTIWVPASAMTSRTTSGAAATTRETNGITMSLLAFDTAADEGANFHVAFPKSWDAGTVTYQAFWTAAASTGTVEFELRGGSFANDAAINTSGFGSAVAVSDTLLATNDVHVTSESAAVTLSNAAADTVSFFEIIRDVSDDTLGADAELIGIKFFYTTSAGNDA